MEKVLSLVVVVGFLALCYAQDAEQDPSKWKCPKEFSMLEYMRPIHCRKEKPHCPKGLICCPCPKTGKKYCIRPRTEDGSVDTKDDETFWQAMREEFMQSHKKEHYECDDDDDDDDDDHHKGEKDDMVFELDRMGDREEGHGHKKHHTRCHHRHMHKVVKIVVPIVGLVVIVAIVVAVFCCIRRKRMRQAEMMTKNSPYTPGNIAPVPEKGSIKGFLGLDFSPEVFVSSQSSYKKLEEEKERI